MNLIFCGHTKFEYPQTSYAILESMAIFLDSRTLSLPPCLQSNKSRDLLFCTSFDCLMQFGRERESCRNPSHGRSLIILAWLVWLCYVLSRNWNSYEVESEISAFINAHACKLRARFIIPTLGLGGHFSIISLC